MQTQQYNIVHPHSGYYNAAPNTYPIMQEQYTAPSSVGDFMSFSRGSSLVYPQDDYDYFSDRSRHSSSDFIDASVSGLAGNSAPGAEMDYRPESTTMAYPPSWRWTSSTDASVPIPAPIYSSATVREKIRPDYPLVIATTTTSLPTPAAMTVMLNRSSQSDVRHPYQTPVSSPTSAIAAGTTRPEQEPGPDAAQSREKKHACSMCHKRFDRPSTLRKHLLVHTGEKAFVCNTCGRRFGVASNLNRHVRKCVLKPIHAASASSNDSTSGSPHSVSPVPSDGSRMSTPNNKRNRDMAFSSDQSAARQGAPRHPDAAAKPTIAKRRRRAPSPSQWIPCSLSNFNLSSDELQKATPVPLPPVRRSMPKEERDSWDENVNATPYHPRGWKDVLPGPASGICSGLRNLKIGGNGSYNMSGRVLVF